MSMEAQQDGQPSTSPEFSGLVLPLDVPPPGWGLWKGSGGFRLEAETLVLPGHPACRRIPLEALVSAETHGRELSLVFRNHTGQEALSLPLPADAEKILGLIRKLASESRRWRELSADPASPADTVGAVDEIARWQGIPWVRAADLLLRLAVVSAATDLHLEPLSDRTRVTMRVRGTLRDAGTFRAGGHGGIVARLKHLAGCHSHLTGIPQEGAWSLPGTPAVEARLAVFPSLDGERCAIRLIRPLQFPDLESLGWDHGLIGAWRSLLARGPGLILLTGPVGSGKTTALYATLAELARGATEARRVVTLEDPVEGKVPGICQSSLDARAGLGLAEAFKHLLRQDPDVMALGEVRDPASLREILQAGLAGHLVLATFHAATAQGALDRMRQMGATPDLLASGLRGLACLHLTTGQNPDDPRPSVELAEVCADSLSGNVQAIPLTAPPPDRSLSCGRAAGGSPRATDGSAREPDQ